LKLFLSMFSLSLFSLPPSSFLFILPTRHNGCDSGLGAVQHILTSSKYCLHTPCIKLSLLSRPALPSSHYSPDLHCQALSTLQTCTVKSSLPASPQPPGHTLVHHIVHLLYSACGMETA
jgi:hypothetical protein